MKPRISLRQSLQDPNLLGGALTGESWAEWRTLLVASMGESLTEDERETFRALTGRDREPLQRVDQFAAVIGRRGWKESRYGTLACYLAGLCEHTDAFERQPWLGVTYLASIDQYTCITAKTYAVLTPNSSIPLAASRAPIICQGRCSVSPDPPRVDIESTE